MNNSKNIRQKLYTYFLNKELSALKNKHQSINLANAHSIGVVFQDDDLDKKKSILRFANELKAQGKTVKILAFIPAKETPENLPFDAFSKKDIDWIYRPKRNDVNEFQNTPFDILFNFDNNANRSLEYICTLARAKFRVGTLSANTNCFDLMVDCNAKANTNRIIEQMKFYLAKMNSKPVLALA